MNIVTCVGCSEYKGMIAGIEGTWMCRRSVMTLTEDDAIPTHCIRKLEHRLIEPGPMRKIRERMTMEILSGKAIDTKKMFLEFEMAMRVN